ncbi:MAG: hypothetical protein L6Q60_07500 [Rhodocyclaceae bacterium]|nr:hypothetical protein [Rhodocyclaceae bacterium]
MEDMKESTGQESPPADEAVATRRFALPQLSKRTLLLIGAGVLLLIIAIAAALSYRAVAAKKEAAKQLAEKTLRERQEGERKAAEAAAEMAKAGEEARERHRRILDQSAMPASVPAPVEAAAAVSAAAVVPAVTPSAPVSLSAEKPVPIAAPSPAPGAASPPAPIAAPPPAASAAPVPAASAAAKPPANAPQTTRAPTASRGTGEVATPDAAGGCTLSGQVAEDYGKALARCLEEYNRLEGRPRR